MEALLCWVFPLPLVRTVNILPTDFDTCLFLSSCCLVLLMFCVVEEAWIIEENICFAIFILPLLLLLPFLFSSLPLLVPNLTFPCFPQFSLVVWRLTITQCAPYLRPLLKVNHHSTWLSVACSPLFPHHIEGSLLPCFTLFFFQTFPVIFKF